MKLIKKLLDESKKLYTHIYIELVLEEQAWYLGHVSTVHIYLSMYSITIDMDHWFDCDSSILVMNNSIPIYFIFLINSLFADIPLIVGLPQPP